MKARSHPNMLAAQSWMSGGTFGVILSLTVNTYPMPSLSTATVSMSARNGTSAKTWWKVIASIHKEMVKVQDAGVMGYHIADGSPYSFQYSMFQFNTTKTTSIDRLIGPLVTHVQSHNNSVDSSSLSSWLSDWYAIEEIVPSSGDVGLKYGARATRLIPRKAVEDTASLAETLEIIGKRNDDFAVRSTPLLLVK